MLRDTLKQTRRPIPVTVSDPENHDSRRKKKVENVYNNDIDRQVAYLLFDSATGNPSTETKVSIDDNNVLDILSIL